MKGETNLTGLLQTMQPTLHEKTYVFCTVSSLAGIHLQSIICFFKEEEGITLIIEKAQADKLQLEYTFVAAWITLSVHSALEAVGLTAAFSAALTAAGISCNVVAAFYHDHIFVKRQDAEKAMAVLRNLSASH